MPSTPIFQFAQEMEKSLSRRVRQESLSGELGWCLVRHYRELIDQVYSETEGRVPLNAHEEAQVKQNLSAIYQRFEDDLKRLALASPSPASFLDDDEGSVLDDVSSVYYDDDFIESSPEPESFPGTPPHGSIHLYPESSAVPSMIMSDDSSFLTLTTTPITARPSNPTPNANRNDISVPITPPKHSFPGTYNPTPFAELSLSRGVPYEAQFIDLNKVSPRILLGGKNSPRATTPPVSSAHNPVPKKKKSFWQRVSSSSSSSDKENHKSKERKKQREELKPPTFWGPM